MWPVLFESGDLIIYSYPFFMGLAWGLGLLMVEGYLSPGISLPKIRFWMVGLFLCAWLGSKLLFLFVQNQYDSSVLAINSNFWLGGGLVFWGGLIFGALYVLVTSKYYLKIKDYNFFVLPLILGHALGRVGCFLAGCCYGSETELPWGVHLHGEFRHPVQLYEALLLIVGFVLLRKTNSKRALKYFIYYSFVRFVIEFFRGDVGRGFILGLSTSQVISGLFFLVIGVFYLKVRGATKSSPI